MNGISKVASPGTSVFVPPGVQTRRLTASADAGTLAGPATQAVPVIYVMGTGRSGSTVLDTILGHHPQAIGVGELCNLHQIGWINNEYCACGQRALRCEFWSAVRSRWSELVGHGSVENYVALQCRFESFRRLGSLRWRHLLRAARPGNGMTDYLTQTAKVYEAIRDVSGASVVVDSSKSPLRAALLARNPAIQLSLLHLVRDVRGVVWSQKKTHEKNERAGIQRQFTPRSTWKSALRWTLANAVSDRVRKRYGVSMLIRYEDFVSHAGDVLRKIGELTSLEFASVIGSLESNEPVPIGHTIAGNRARMSGQIRLSPDTQWREMLPARDRRICGVLSRRLMRSYGYDR